MLDIPTAKARIPTNVPGATSLEPQPAPYTAPVYKYAGQGWNDPLAQQAYGNVKGDESLQRLRRVSPEGPTSGYHYSSPMDPTKWGVNYHGGVYDKMKAEYLRLGGTGTVEQSNAAARAAAPVASGSQHSLAPEVLNKMWR
jgi:hypothetical protein